MLVFPESPSNMHEAVLAEDISRTEEDPCDDLCCFVTFATPSDGVLGLGLFCHQQTRQQQRAYLSPDFDIVGDYVEVEAFNEGILRAAASRRPWRARQEYPSFTSSMRRRINCWLPLYLGPHHWKEAKRYAPSALAQLAGVCDGWHSSAVDKTSDIDPACTLDVFCSILTSAVVGFTVGQSASSTPRSAARGKASERAVQMYADVHRLFLQMAREIPDMRRLAMQRLQDFIEDPLARTPERTPDLGRLVHCLLIVEEIAWEDLTPTLLPEALRRHALRQRCRGRHFDPKECGDSAEALVSAWDSFAMHVGLVIGFCVLFCRTIAKHGACTLTEVEIKYDDCWGRLGEDVMADILHASSVLSQCQSLVRVLEMLQPLSFGLERLDNVCELILWAERHGRYWGTHAIAEEEWPQIKGEYCPLLQTWQKQQRKQKESNQAKKRSRRHAPSWKSHDCYQSYPWMPFELALHYGTQDGYWYYWW
jgi:hypothetical protein